MDRFSDLSHRFPALSFRLLCAMIFLSLFLPSSGVLAQEAFDIEAWHQMHPLSREEAPVQKGLKLGLLPSAGIVLGIPNGLAGNLQLSISLRRPKKFGFYFGGGYEMGAAVRGNNFTLGWGGVRRIPATVPQLGFSGAFLRYRRWDSDNHGRHRGLSIGIENSLGSVALSAEIGLSRSDRNHWIPSARIGLSYALPLLWDL